MFIKSKFHAAAFILGTRLDRQFSQFDTDDLVKRMESIGIICKTVSANPGSIASGAEGTATVAVTGLTSAHKVFAMLGADVTVGLALRAARVSAPGELSLDYDNFSGGAIDEAAHSVQILAIPGDLN